MEPAAIRSPDVWRAGVGTSLVLRELMGALLAAPGVPRTGSRAANAAASRVDRLPKTYRRTRGKDGRGQLHGGSRVAHYLCCAFPEPLVCRRCRSRRSRSHGLRLRSGAVASGAARNGSA